MSENLIELIRAFEFNNLTRADCLISDSTKIRIDGLNNYAILKQDANYKYSTDANLYVATELVNPTKVKEWKFFEIDADIPSDTSIGYQLSDGTNRYFWSGSAWTQGTGTWNTQAEIEANIDTFPTTSKKLRVYANLKTTDTLKTPILRSIKVLMKVGASMEEELFIRTLIPYLRSARIIGDIRFKLDMDADTLTYVNLQEMENFNITAIKACFNLTTDPGEDTDILSSYNLSDKTIKLTGVQNFENVILVKFEYEPEVAMMTSPDYIEISKVPAIIIESMTEIETLSPSNIAVIKDKTNLNARVIQFAEAQTIDLTLTLVSHNLTDQFRLSQACKELFGDSPLMTISAFDIDCGLVVISPFISAFRATQEHLPTSSASIRLVNANFLTKAAYDRYLVNKKILTLTKQQS